MRRAFGLLMALFLASAMPAEASRHVRVVLDLSISMRKNDPGRLAILATALLHDLAQPNPSTGDTFEVIPFNLDWHWPSATAAPPVSTQPHIKAELGNRAELVRALEALPYQAKMTYFYPGIAAALEDLEQTKGGAYDVRTIVLVTDGVPELPTRDAELQHIRTELAPRLEKDGIRLYILAFGSEADRNRDFFNQVVTSPANTSLGEYFVDPQGTQLLSYMLQIFARSFGFTPDTAHSLTGTTSLDLEGSATPERVAVAVFSTRAQPPRLRLTPPASGSVNDPEGVQSAGTAGGSYSLMWALQPNKGLYGIDSDVISGSVAVLRPTRLALDIVPSPPLKQAERTMAGTPFPVRVVVRSPSGAQGDPGPVDLSFRISGERKPGGTMSSYKWQSERRAPPAGAGTVTNFGRAYDIVTEFHEDPETPARTYVGYVEVEARRGEAVIGQLTGTKAHSVEVHPLMAISPLPLSGYASSKALERKQGACTHFAFQLSAGRLPHEDRPQYPVRTVIIPSDPAQIDHELNQATFTLDGLPLDLDKPSPQPGPWYKGRTLNQLELLGDHELCVRMGKPTTGDPSHPLELAVAATLLEDPYDEFRVIQPFTLKVLVSPPTFLEKWRGMLVGAGSLLAVLALFWYARDRPAFPSDLRYSVGREDSTAGLATRPLEERSAFATLFGLAGESAVIPPGQDRPLGRVRPVSAELFQLRPARGVRVEATERAEGIPMRRGLATLSIHRTYRLHTEQGSYLFRMEYE